ncbi:hypothetical protein DTL70_26025 [Streptomyces diacarni]|uniref:DUF6801 domain-containing protein n=1 Tax=Streptomyces diacarni TaxID=2800381 RepID=A0A367EMK0_9ACTN|nr:DUF6801 domain-containing protein [Streptomyces diacarni]RCG18617.1 hypothetical protein DTL70_26025 [Streptomyces diacarni]
MRPSARTRRRTARGAAVAAVALVAGVLPGTGSQAQDSEATVRAAFTCAFPTGTQRVAAEISATFPASGTPGSPLRVSGLDVETVLSAKTLAEILPAGTTDVASEATLTVRVAQGTSDAEARWDGLKAPSTPVWDAADLTLAHRGEVPPVTVEHAGKVTFIVGALDLDLAPQGEPSAGPSTLPAKAPPAARCTPADERSPVLATVPVGDQEGSPRPSASPTPTGSAAPPGRDEGGQGDEDGRSARREAGIDVGDDPLPPAKPCESERPTAELDRSKLPEPPPGVTMVKLAGTHWCTVPVAVANVLKLRGGMAINDPADGATTANLLINVESGSNGTYNQTRSVGEVTLPDASATFLDFDLMPVTAKIEFTGTPMTIVTEQRGNTLPNYATIFMSQTLRMHDVAVNGTPLPVGPHCRTEKPVDIELHGVGPDEYHVFKGGVLRAELDIPAFTGCGTGGEDLDRLFTASISGSGNYMKLIQGKPCLMRPGGLGCALPPEVPELPR